MKSVMQHNFARTPKVVTPRSTFNRSSSHKTTFDGGILVPIFVDEVMPGDTMNMNMSAFCRFSATALERPPMDNAYMDSHFWFVPYRLLQTNFVKIMGERTDPGDSIDYVLPPCTMPAVTGATVGSNYDYLGVPPGVASLEIQNNMPARAINFIWNNCYRAEQIQDSVPVDMDDGPDDYADYATPLRRGKRFDRYTSCLPEPQLGDPVDMPLGTTAPVITNNQTPKIKLAAQAPGNLQLENIGGKVTLTGDQGTTGLPGLAVWGTETGMVANLAGALAPTINTIREAATTQQFLERDARGGTRYPELIYSHFGVVSPDARLQRPEYLGGGSSPVISHSVAGTNQSGSGATAPGQLSAFATVSASGHSFTKSFTEHGVIIGFVSVRADLTYQQGLPKIFSRSSRYDFYWPDFNGIGEQPVYTRELFCDGSATDDDVFGYLPYGDEYRTMESKISGLLRSGVSGTLDNFTFSQEFPSAPTLDSTFIQDDPPFDRVVAVSTEPHFIADFYFKYICARPMPTHSVPGIMRF